MGRLSTNEILRHKVEGNIVIEPFIERHLNTVSYDVRLGEYFYRVNDDSPILFNPWNNDSDETNGSLWNTEAEKAVPASRILSSIDRKKYGVLGHEKIIILKPLETVLGHTIEFIGGKNCVTSDMSARSSAGRSNILVCKCAGYGDVGFYNRWTMEITNISVRRHLILTVGRRIAQISFEEVEPIKDSYNRSGKYQNDSSVEELMANWKPEMMLPKMYLDYEVNK